MLKNQAVSKKLNIYPNSTINVIHIDKIEYFILYTHGAYNEDNLNTSESEVGQITLISRVPVNGEYLYLKSKDKLLISESLNRNIGNEEKSTLNRVINILEGAQLYNECFKLDCGEEDNESKLLKIVQTVRNRNTSVSVKLFSCEMLVLGSLRADEVMSVFNYYFKSKIEKKETLMKKVGELSIKLNSEREKYIKLSNEIEDEDTSMMNEICSLLNEKKGKIRQLKRMIEDFGSCSKKKESTQEVEVSLENLAPKQSASSILAESRRSSQRLGSSFINPNSMSLVEDTQNNSNNNSHNNSAYSLTDL